MAVHFFGEQDDAGSRVWSANSAGANHQDEAQLRARIRELESLCTDVLVAGIELGLPQSLLNQLWAAVGHGEAPHAYHVDMPTPNVFKKEAVASAKREPMQIPDIPLTTNPLMAGKDDVRSSASQTELKPLAIRKTVCVVDDDPMMLDVLERILRRENFELFLAGGGPEIMTKLAAHTGQVDLLVTDYAMPEMQGRELADQIRKRFPAVKVLYQTGFSDRLFENRVELEEGAAFLEKPFTARGLREAARLVLFGSINP